MTPIQWRNLQSLYHWLTGLSVVINQYTIYLWPVSPDKAQSGNLLSPQESSRWQCWSTDGSFVSTGSRRDAFASDSPPQTSVTLIIERPDVYFAEWIHASPTWVLGGMWPFTWDTFLRSVTVRMGKKSQPVRRLAAAWPLPRQRPTWGSLIESGPAYNDIVFFWLS